MVVGYRFFICLVYLCTRTKQNSYSLCSRLDRNTSLYDKCDDFNFINTNTPFLSSNIQSSPSYGVLSHNLSDMQEFAPLINVLFGGLCDFPMNFPGRDMSRNVWKRLKEVLWSVRGSYQTIWGSPFPNVTRNSGGWPYTVAPSIAQTLHQFLTLLLIWTLLPNLTFLLNDRGLDGTFATGVVCRQTTLTHPDIWSCLPLGLPYVLMSRSISLELVLFPDFWVSNSPWYFCFD